MTNFENFLLLVLYFFIPWTAVNLVDYFIVRHGHYAIAEIFKPDGIYGRWGWRGIVSYLVGFAAMVPVLQHRARSSPAGSPSAAKGADFSLFIGLPVSGILYWVLSRNIDVDAEQAARRARRPTSSRRRPTSTCVPRPHERCRRAGRWPRRSGRARPPRSSSSRRPLAHHRGEGRRDQRVHRRARRARPSTRRGTPTGGRGRGPAARSAYPCRSRTTSGWPAHRRPTARWRCADFVPDVDAVPVARLRAAGAVVVGKTNNPEFCYRGYTDNDVFGLTRNPWSLGPDARRLVGRGRARRWRTARRRSRWAPTAAARSGSRRRSAAWSGTSRRFGLVPKMPGFRGWPSALGGRAADPDRARRGAGAVGDGRPVAARRASWPVDAGDLRRRGDRAPWTGRRCGSRSRRTSAGHRSSRSVRAAFRAAVDVLADDGARVVEAAPGRAVPDRAVERHRAARGVRLGGAAARPVAGTG